MRSVYNKKVYEPEFKLSMVKEYLKSYKSQAQIYEEYSISPSMFFRWLKKYKESGYDDSVFNVSRGQSEAIISDYSKISAFIFESTGTSKDGSANQNNILVWENRIIMRKHSFTRKQSLVDLD